jgi:HD-like signal output (HDOD) protein
MNGFPLSKKERLERIRAYISKMPSLSTTMTKVLEVCNNANTSPNDLNRVISLDPVLTGQVLKLINSAYYALPDQVTSLTRAIIMLGLNTVKNLALSVAVLKTLGGAKDSPGLAMDDFWSHSICVGVTGKALAALKGVPDTAREEYFVAGLLHDLGKIPLSRCFPHEYTQALELAGTGRRPLHQIEEMFMGMSHCGVGHMIAEKWRLNSVMHDALARHHDHTAARGENRQTTAIVALANACANQRLLEREEVSADEESALNPLLQETAIPWHALRGLKKTVSGEMEKARVFLSVGGKDRIHAN